jgi:uncharacterized protein
MKRSVTSLPLHYGKAPHWLFKKMTVLSAAIAETIFLEFGPGEFLARIADPLWFQALGCAVGFDWHSSGLTTTLCGALKEGLAALGDDTPVAVCGGKAKRAIHTPEELEAYGEKWGIDTSAHVTMSRLCAKIDNSGIQDGYNLYHHVFILARSGEWAIVQQGMNTRQKSARRYQWLWRDDLDVTCEPHTGITCNETGNVLNLVARESMDVREAAVEFVKQPPAHMIATWNDVALAMPKRHYISPDDLNKTRLFKIFEAIHESEPDTFKDLIQVKGVGPKTLSALSLISELVYEKPPSFRDPARFSFAHGGKDGHPFPVDRTTYDESIGFLKTCLDRAKIGDKDKMDAFKKLSSFG